MVHYKVDPVLVQCYYTGKMLEKSEVIEEILLCIYGIEKLEGHTTG
jgi:hypothetical protein